MLDYFSVYHFVYLCLLNVLCNVYMSVQGVFICHVYMLCHSYMLCLICVKYLKNITC